MRSGWRCVRSDQKGDSVDFCGVSVRARSGWLLFRSDLGKSVRAGSRWLFFFGQIGGGVRIGTGCIRSDQWNVLVRSDWDGYSGVRTGNGWGGFRSDFGESVRIGSRWLHSVGSVESVEPGVRGFVLFDWDGYVRVRTGSGWLFFSVRLGEAFGLGSVWLHSVRPLGSFGPGAWRNLSGFRYQRQF